MVWKGSWGLTKERISKRGFDDDEFFLLSVNYYIITAILSWSQSYILQTWISYPNVTWHMRKPCPRGMHLIIYISYLSRFGDGGKSAPPISESLPQSKILINLGSSPFITPSCPNLVTITVISVLLSLYLDNLEQMCPLSC